METMARTEFVARLPCAAAAGTGKRGEKFRVVSG
jgi:hypothetical protein